MIVELFRRALYNKYQNLICTFPLKKPKGKHELFFFSKNCFPSLEKIGFEVMTLFYEKPVFFFSKTVSTYTFTLQTCYLMTLR